MTSGHVHHHHDHGSDHGHGHHHHGHHHGPVDYGRAFAIGIVLNLAFVAVEAAAGIYGNSVALLADAGHNLSDVLGLALAWGAHVLSRRPPTQRFTYGYQGSSILAALTNAVFLMLACGAIGWEALRRLADPPQVAGDVMMIVAGIGIVINLATALLFAAGRHGDLNIRGAFLHMIADAAVSAGVVVAGLTVKLTGLSWIDPAVSLVVVLVILIGTGGLFRDSLVMALGGVPGAIDPQAVIAHLSQQPGILGVHHLHIWPMSTTASALTAHLVMPDGHPGDAFLAELALMMDELFDIRHATFQVETGVACPVPDPRCSF